MQDKVAYKPKNSMYFKHFGIVAQFLSAYYYYY